MTTTSSAATPIVIGQPVALLSIPDVGIGNLESVDKGWAKIEGLGRKYRPNKLAPFIVAPADATEDEESIVTTEDEESKPAGMAAQLKAARVRYVKSKSYRGKPSAHNNDGLAQMLAGCSPMEAMELTEAVMNVTEEGGFKSPWERYKHLNPGQQRMNSGNLLRARLVKGLITLDAITALYLKMDADEEEADEEEAEANGVDYRDYDALNEATEE